MQKPRTGRPSRSPLVSLEVMEARLNDGYERIEAAQAAGLDIVAWEAFWLELLRQYEAACDAIESARAA